MISQNFYFSLEAAWPLWKSEANHCRGHLDPHIWYSNDFPWSRDVKIDFGLGRPRATSEFQRGHTASRLEIFFFRNQILFIVLKYEPNRTTGTLPNCILFIQKLYTLWRLFWPQKSTFQTFFNWSWKLMPKLISRWPAELFLSLGTCFFKGCT